MKWEKGGRWESGVPVPVLAATSSTSKVVPPSVMGEALDPKCVEVLPSTKFYWVSYSDLRPWISVLGLPNKIPQTGWLKQQKFSHSCAGQKFQHLKSRCRQGHARSEDSRGEAFLASSTFWGLQSFLGSWLHHVHLYPVFTWPSLLCVLPLPSVSYK